MPDGRRSDCVDYIQPADLALVKNDDIIPLTDLNSDAGPQNTHRSRAFDRQKQ